MPDPADPTDRPARSRPGRADPEPGNGDAAPSPSRPPVKVTWRGLVDTATPTSSFGRFFAAIGRLLRSFLVVVGLARPRLDDGTYGERNLRRFAVVTGVTVTVLAVISMVRIVNAGTVAVPVTLGAAQSELRPGVHVTPPWPLTYTVETSTQTENYTMSKLKGEGVDKRADVDDSVTVLGRDGATADVDATVLYRVRPDRASALYENVGPQYREKIIRPSARTCIRTEFTAYDMVSAATEQWGTVAEGIAGCMREKLDADGIELVDFQMREVALGKDVQGAIDDKAAAQQRAEQQRFDLSTAQQQADIERVKAIATADSQQILACGGTTQMVERGGKTVEAIVPNPVENCTQAQLTPAFLQYTYIQALKGLVNSPNNSTLILPFDENLTPLINLDGSAAPVPDSTNTAPAQTQPDATAPPPDQVARAGNGAEAAAGSG